MEKKRYRKEECRLREAPELDSPETKKRVCRRQSRDCVGSSKNESSKSVSAGNSSNESMPTCGERGKGYFSAFSDSSSNSSMVSFSSDSSNSLIKQQEGRKGSFSSKSEDHQTPEHAKSTSQSTSKQPCQNISRSNQSSSDKTSQRSEQSRRWEGYQEQRAKEVNIRENKIYQAQNYGAYRTPSTKVERASQLHRTNSTRSYRRS